MGAYGDGGIVGAIFAPSVTSVSSILEGWWSGKASWNRQHLTGHLQFK